MVHCVEGCFEVDKKRALEFAGFIMKALRDSEEVDVRSKFSDESCLRFVDFLSAVFFEFSNDVQLQKFPHWG